MNTCFELQCNFINFKTKQKNISITLLRLWYYLRKSFPNVLKFVKFIEQYFSLNIYRLHLEYVS